MEPKSAVEVEVDDGIARLRAEARAYAAWCERTGREAGRTWAREAGVRALKRQAAAIDRCATVRLYIDDAEADPRGLPTRLYIDLTGSTCGESVEPDEVNAFWADVFNGEADAIQDPDVALAFVTAVHSLWVVVKS